MLGIFIEPEGKLKKFIIRWKYKIRKNYTNTNYVNHPTHSTIYTANLKNKKKVIIEIREVLKNFKSFKIKINKTDIFFNDKFTNKDTIYLNIKKNKKIYILQKKIAEKLKIFKKKDNLKNKKFFDTNLKNSFKKYGFPFVGSHWKPHFTIGSIKDFAKKKDFRKFIKTKINFENNVKTISLWKITKLRHIKIKEFKLNK